MIWLVRFCTLPTPTPDDAVAAVPARRECCCEVHFDLLEEGRTEETDSCPEHAIRGD